MSDRELLELAAKAAGLKPATNQLGESGVCDLYGSGWCAWNPLTDDGDALRLAISAKVDLEFGQEYTTASAYTHKGYVGAFQEKHSNTRRAIVRAAAEIGRLMP